MAERTLANLLRKAQQADQQALCELLKQFQPLIRACCSGLAKPDQEDLKQELLIKLIVLVRRYALSDRAWH